MSTYVSLFPLDKYCRLAKDMRSGIYVPVYMSAHSSVSTSHWISTHLRTLPSDIRFKQIFVSIALIKRSVRQFANHYLLAYCIRDYELELSNIFSKLLFYRFFVYCSLKLCKTKFFSASKVRFSDCAFYLIKYNFDLKMVWILNKSDVI